MKEKIQKVFRQNIPFVVVFVAALIWHLVIKISAGDDVVYFQTLMDGRSIWEILAHRYATWSSRMAIEFVLIPLVQVPWLWKILDIIVFTLIPVLLYRLLFLNPEKYLDMECNINKTAGKWLVCAFMLLYPFSDMVSAGWIATTVNYLWPLLGLLYIALLLQKLAQKGHVHWYEGAGGVVSCIFCSSQEQVAAILLVLLFLAMVYSWRRKKSGSLWIYGYAVIDVISLFTILRCPGNGIRSMQEVEGRMPEFAYFSVWEKIYMGAANIERIFVAQVNSIFLIVSAVLAVLVGLKTKNLIKTLLSSVPVFCILGYALIRTGHPWYEKIFIIPKQTAEWNFKDPANWFPVIFLIVTVAGMSYALFRECELTGLPIMRPLVLHYENDPEVWNLNGEFLVGENLLAAPVLEQGETKKIVYLPEGVWYDYETKKPYQGRQYYMVDAPLDTCPMFVKEGGMIPTYELAQYVGEKPYDTLKMRVYPGNGTYLHYQDNGADFAYRDGAYNVYEFTHEGDKKEASVQMKKEGYTKYKNILFE